MDELAEIVAKELDRLENHYVHKAIQLMENENTIPFIARYRSVQTGGMDAQDLREIKTLYDNMRYVVDIDASRCRGWRLKIAQAPKHPWNEMINSIHSNFILTLKAIDQESQPF